MLDAFIGAIVGSLATAFLAFGAWFWAARGEVARHDVLMNHANEDIETWIADRDLALARELSALANELNKRTALDSGAFVQSKANLKAQALHELRDQQRRVRRERDLRAAGEDLRHSVW